MKRQDKGRVGGNGWLRWGQTEWVSQTVQEKSMVVFVVMYVCHCQSVGGKGYQVLSRHCRKCVGRKVLSRHCRKIVQGKVGVVEKVKSKEMKGVTGNMRQKGKVTEIVGEMMERVDKVKVVVEWCIVL